MKPEDSLRQEIKALLTKYQLPPFIMDDETIEDILEETLEDLESGRDTPPY